MMIYQWYLKQFFVILKHFKILFLLSSIKVLKLYINKVLKIF